MADEKPATIRATDVSPRTASIYPAAYAKALEGRAKRSLGDVFGLSQFGVHLTVLAPGSASSQRHWHEQEDEFVYILEGEAVLVDDAGEHVLKPGMCAGFKSGVPNGHKLVNRSAGPVTYLEIGTRSTVETAHYPDPDVDMKAVKVDGKFKLFRKDGTPY
jgi:uncharacterized cupin superfamily protein